MRHTKTKNGLMDTYRDRALIGALIEREVESRMSWAKFAQASNVSRATLYRAKDGDARVTEQIYRRIERALGFPFDSLSSVGAHDFDVLKTMGMDRGLIEWLKRRVDQESSSATDALGTSKRRGPRVTAQVSEKD